MLLPSQALSSSSVTNDICTILSYTSTATACACTVPIAAFSSASRRLQDGETRRELATSGMLQIGTITAKSVIVTPQIVVTPKIVAQPPSFLPTSFPTLPMTYSPTVAPTAEATVIGTTKDETSVIAVVSGLNSKYVIIISVVVVVVALTLLAICCYGRRTGSSSAQRGVRTRNNENIADNRDISDIDIPEGLIVPWVALDIIYDDKNQTNGTNPDPKCFRYTKKLKHIYFLYVNICIYLHILLY